MFNLVKPLTHCSSTIRIMVWAASVCAALSIEAVQGQSVAESPPAAVSSPSPCQFKGVTPGTSTVDDVIIALGTPVATDEVDGLQTQVFEIEPFPRVEVMSRHQVVTSVVLHLKTPASPAQLEQELQLEGSEPVSVYSDDGKLLGRAYPERGVLMSFDPEQSAHRATQLLLEPITAEPFRLRVQADTGHHYQRNLSDLEMAHQLEPNESETLRLLSLAYAAAGEVDQARRHLDTAMERLPGNPQLTLDRVELLIRLDQLDEALSRAQGVVADRHQDPEVAGRAEKLLGDVLGLGVRRDFERAVEHHLAAIKLLAPLANDGRLAQRRQAKQLLVATFLSVARDIAAGDWQNQEVTTEKWLSSARELCESLITRDQGDELWRLRVILASLSVRAECASSQPVDSQLAAINRMVEQLAADSQDPVFRRELELQRVQALFDAATMAHRRSQHAQARDFAEQGIRAAEAVVNQRQLLPMERYVLGRLYFFVGSGTAVTDKNHARAVLMYAKAREFFDGTPPQVAAFDLARHGERWVSMGASYFESGEQELGLRLTKEGLDKLKGAAASGLTDDSALALPYSNLAAMYKVLGGTQQSREYSEMAARVESRPIGPVRR